MKVSNLISMGHSHLQDIEHAYDDTKQNLTNINVISFIRLFEEKYNHLVEYHEGNPALNKNIENELNEKIGNANCDAIITNLLGSEHLLWSAQAGNRKFDVILPFADHLPRISDVEIIPYGALSNMFREALVPYLKASEYILKTTNVPVYQILPPPPIGSDEKILESAPDLLKNLFVEFGVPNPIIRYKMWMLWIHIAKEIAAEAGFQVVEAPDEGLDDNGFVKLEFARDCVHANSRFGQLIWKKIDNIFYNRT